MKIVERKLTAFFEERLTVRHGVYLLVPGMECILIFILGISGESMLISSSGITGMLYLAMVLCNLFFISDIVFDLYSKTLFCKFAFITNCTVSFFCAYLVFVNFDNFGGYSRGQWHFRGQTLTPVTRILLAFNGLIMIVFAIYIIYGKLGIRWKERMSSANR